MNRNRILIQLLTFFVVLMAFFFVYPKNVDAICTGSVNCCVTGVWDGSKYNCTSWSSIPCGQRLASSPCQPVRPVFSCLIVTGGCSTVSSGGGGNPPPTGWTTGTPGCSARSSLGAVERINKTEVKEMRVEVSYWFGTVGNVRFTSSDYTVANFSPKPFFDNNYPYVASITGSGGSTPGEEATVTAAVFT